MTPLSVLDVWNAVFIFPIPCLIVCIGSNLKISRPIRASSYSTQRSTMVKAYPNATPNSRALIGHLLALILLHICLCLVC
ncbi:hypothetical protein EDB19DRAFT_1767174 [Suillus lakei]|nr:hypothetical protein EDB19DRAFT_1767174 [Suillus lakei]